MNEDNVRTDKIFANSVLVRSRSPLYRLITGLDSDSDGHKMPRSGFQSSINPYRKTTNPLISLVKASSSASDSETQPRGTEPAVSMP